MRIFVISAIAALAMVVGSANAADKVATAIVSDTKGVPLVYLDTDMRVHGHLQQRPWYLLGGLRVVPEVQELTSEQVAARHEIERIFAEAKLAKAGKPVAEKKGNLARLMFWK
jgi:hypothetical protein